MRQQLPDSGLRGRRVAGGAFLLLGSGLSLALFAQTTSEIEPTRHNLSVSAPASLPPASPEIRAETETRICIFCHTPHNAAPDSPLWNKDLTGQNYVVYTSPTLRAGIPPPSGPTKLCLSCHDGTIALGTVLNPGSGIAMVGGDAPIPSGSLSNFGTDLTGHHPVSFPYSASLPNPDLASTPPSDLVFGAGDEVHCTTCHDPHDDRNGKFLVKDNRYSALCVSCHQMTGWESSIHATSTAPVNGVLPLPPKTFPNWTQLDEWGCETCHTPHFAPTPEQLLNFTSAPPEPFDCVTSGCHSGSTGPPHAPSAPGLLSTAPIAGGLPQADIASQVRKSSAHHQPADLAAYSQRRAQGPSRSGIREVDCADCHNPHLATKQAAEPPFVSGAMIGVPGVDRSGGEIPSATYEYEVCFRCHGDNSVDTQFVQRVVGSTNTRLDFDPGNASYHPVVSIGKTFDVPSIPSSLSPAMSASSQIYCSSCHADDEGGSNGPHGSSFPPILKARYETGDGTSESYETYALCYGCHERTNLLADVSFRRKIARTTPSGGGHSGHLAAGAPCSACHDPHGIDAGSASFDTGDHTHLINFDTRIVLPLGAASYPVYRETGPGTGNCTLVCHGVTHDGTSYP